MADYGTIKVNKVTYKNGSDADTDFDFKTDIVSLNSPTFTGTPAAPTAAADTNTTQLATTAYVQTELGDYLTSTLGATKASPTFTGTPAAPTASVSTNTTQVATTAFVVAEIADEVGTTVQAYDADTAKKDVDQEFTKPQRGHVEVATHSSGTDYNFDLDVANNWKLTISAAVKLNFTNLDASREGQTGTIWIDNGDVTPTWGDEVAFEGGSTLSITKDVKSLLVYYVLPGGAEVLVIGLLDVQDDA